MTPEQQLERVRKLCFAFPETSERLSHGEPTFFVRGKKVFVMFADDHHEDGRIAVWLPASPGLQEVLVETQPETFFKPPYVGVRGWIGIDLNQISDEDLQFYIRSGWFLIAPKKLQAQFNETQ
ncbi:MAG: MmcQ/YjbR family DNA-binding protein [Ardenticatenaceae bacterium]|nr:MmcQ/YjbR family DNA-binding protein [Ardenticatenaceae bacterium]